ncbi:MAG TPA: mechanosensitive ion channel family protein, partial [Terriglobia bacterium]|nr:mechanosensitive ion channel family protein [Terriglobia bacterium]
LNHLLSRLAGLLRRRLYRKADLPNPELLPKPIRLLLLALVIRRLLAKLDLPLLARQFWSSAASIITIAGCVWLFILLNGWVEGYVNRRLRGHNLTGRTSMLRLTRRVIDVVVIFAGVLVSLHHFGLNPTAALAGLGVGGIAVALAAQKTLENVIGGVSLIFDEVVRVGDFLKVGDTSGTVEDIGLRSTRIRTLERSMVSVPNGHIANMTLENFSSRDKFWFHPILALRYGTASPQMNAVVDGICSLLKGSQHVEPNSVRVRFLRFGVSSLDVEVFAYVLACDWSQFLAIQEKLFLRIMEHLEVAGVQIALPSQTIFVAAASLPTEANGEGLTKTPLPDCVAGDHKAD